MDTFRLGESVQHTKLPVVGIVTNEAVSVKHIGNLLVRRIQVKVGEDNLEWLVENCVPFVEQSALPTIMATA